MSKGQLVDNLINSLNNLLIAKNQKLKVNTRSSNESDIVASTLWQMTLSNLIKCFINELQFDSLELLITDKFVNFYFKNWNEDQSFLKSSEIINTLHFLETTENKISFELKSSTLEKKTLVIGMRLA